MLEFPAMEWTAFMNRTVFRADNIPVKCATAKQARFLPFEIFFPALATGAADNFGSVCHDPADDNAGPFLDDEMIAVKQGNNRIGRLLNADDMVGIEEHLLFVHTGEKNHGSPIASY